MDDTGVPPQAGSGHSPKGGAAISVPSPAKPSVPNALAQIDCLVATLELIVDHRRLAPAKGRPPRILFESAVGCAEMELRAWRDTYADTARALDAYRDYWADGGAWEQDRAGLNEASPNPSHSNTGDRE
jgi:hypothetical protein